MVRQGTAGFQQPAPQNELVMFYKSIPILTRIILTSTIVLSLGCHLRMIPHHWVMLIWSKVFKEFHIWKLVTCFFIYSVNFSFLFDLVLIYQYSISLEKTTFGGRIADYLYFLILVMLFSLGLSNFNDGYILSHSLMLAIVTLWSLENKHSTVTFFFGIKFKAIYLPFILTTTTGVFGVYIPYQFIVGIVASYSYNYLTKVFPISGSTSLLSTPSLLKKLFPDEANSQTPYGFTVTPPSRTGSSPTGYQWGKGSRLGE